VTMNTTLRNLAVAAALSLIATGAAAQESSQGRLSTSANSPTPVAETGVVTGNFPSGTEEATYYLSLDLKPGDLATQISIQGRPGRDKALALDVKDPRGRVVGYTSVLTGLDANQEASRVFPADSGGKYLLIVKTKGPETTSFKIEVGGSALPNRVLQTTESGPFSRSYLAPTPFPKSGGVSGSFPGGEKQIAYYYFAADLKPGDLTTQISFSGRRNAPKMLELALLDSKGRVGANSSHYIMSELDATSEKTRAFPIDSAGRYILRVSMSGAEGTKFKVDLGGSAYQPAP
jgi:hypothetical protein